MRRYVREKKCREVLDTRALGEISRPEKLIFDAPLRRREELHGLCSRMDEVRLYSCRFSEKAVRIDLYAERGRNFLEGTGFLTKFGDSASGSESVHVWGFAGCGVILEIFDCFRLRPESGGKPSGSVLFDRQREREGFLCPNARTSTKF